MAMVRIELIKQIARKYRMPKAQATAILEAILGCLEGSMRQGNRFEIRGLGTFSVRSYGGYRGRDPRSGRAVDVRPKRLPHFKPSSTLLRRMNPCRRDDPAQPGASASTPRPNPPERSREPSAPYT